MAETPSTMVPLGTPAPDFQLPDTNGKLVSLSDFTDAPALLVVFMCNHCPFVQHLRAGLAQFARDYQPRGLAMVGINSNDAASYPEDSFAKMREFSCSGVRGCGRAPFRRPQATNPSSSPMRPGAQESRLHRRRRRIPTERTFHEAKSRSSPPSCASGKCSRRR